MANCQGLRIELTGVEVHIGVQFPIDEVWIGKCNPLQLNSDIYQRIPAGDCKDLVGQLPNLGCPWVEVLVHAMPKAKQLLLCHAVAFGNDTLLWMRGVKRQAMCIFVRCR